MTDLDIWGAFLGGRVDVGNFFLKPKNIVIVITHKRKGFYPQN